ncbi:ABC transporter substrate-binding protein [Pseudactinotalea sp.]|uniref:ABC transporter substrate-binding protein n=1 Tax=Pseudactinotalea sp. TaxID=1926260 RepID=UPI003B3BC0FA
MSHNLTRRSLLSIGLGGAAAAALTACGNGGGSSGSGPAPGAEPTFGASIRMSQFGTTDRQARLAEAFALYSAEYGGSVDVSAIDNSSYAEKLATEMAGGAAADIVGLFHHIVADYARQGQLVDLDAWDTITDVSGLDQDATAGGVIDGQRSALPLGDNAIGAFYDRTRLSDLGFEPLEPGHTWDEFITFANDVSREAGGSYYGTMDASGDTNFFEVFLRQRGKGLYADGGLGFAPADVEEWFGVWEDLRATGAAPPAGLTSESSAGGFGTAMLVTGQAATFFIFSNVFKAFSNLTSSELALTTTPMPSASESGLYVRASNWIAAYTKGDGIDDAVNAIQFLLNDPGAVEVLGTEFGAPPNLELRAELSYDAADQAFVDYVDLVSAEYAQPIGNLAESFPQGSARMTEALRTMSETIAAGDLSVADGSAQLVAQAEGFIG